MSSRAGNSSTTPCVDPSLPTDEEQELELQYREQRIYAVGHGAAADWDVRPGRAARIWSEFMPDAEVPMMTVNIGDDDAVLRLARLAEAPMFHELARFVGGYAGWVADQERIASGLPGGAEQAAAKRISDRMNVALDRMRACVRTLHDDRRAAESFRLADRAMLDQMHRVDRIAGRETGPEDYRLASLGLRGTGSEARDCTGGSTGAGLNRYRVGCCKPCPTEQPYAC